MKVRQMGSGALKASGLALMLVAVCNTGMAGTGPSPTVPEIDPGSILGAVALLAGGLMVLTDRWRVK